MELHGLNKQNLSENGLHPERKFVFLLEEDRIRNTFETSKRIRAEVLRNETARLVIRSLLYLKGLFLGSANKKYQKANNSAVCRGTLQKSNIYK